MMLKLRLIAFALACLITREASAGAMDLNLLDPNVLNGAVPNDVAAAAIKTFGIYFAHRPYQGAVSIFHTNALDLNLEVTMVKIGDGVAKALAANGINNTQAANNIALPIGKIHIRKALSPSMDAGVSAIYYQGQHAIGTDLKIELSNPEEGINTAFRIGYTYATASLLYLNSVSVISPEFVMSRKLEFAEPYLGVGGRLISGTISIPFKINPAPAFTVTKNASGCLTAYAFTGITFQILGPKGFRLGMEGNFDISGFSSIGTLFGIGF